MLGNNILALAGLATVAAATAAVPPYQVAPLLRHNETVVTTTKIVSAYTTYCPEPTTFELGGHTYEVAEPTTLTITDCPCTIVEPCYTCKPTPTGTGVPPGPPPSSVPPGPPAPPGPTTPPEEPTSQPPPVSGAAEGNQQYGVAALAGAAIFGILAL